MALQLIINIKENNNKSVIVVVVGPKGIMTSTRAFLILLLLLGGGLDVSERLAINSKLVGANNGCNVCRMRAQIRALSLEVIKEQILNKLGLKHAPNMTGRALPRIPPISKLLDMYNIQSDEPSSFQRRANNQNSDDINDFTAKTESVFVLSQHRKLSFQS